MGCQTILLDAAMGTRLQEEGLPLNRASPLWNVEKPEIVRRIHQKYLEAGAQILLTNTFGARTEAEIRGAAECIQALPGTYQIAGSIGPTTALESISVLAPAVDFLILETFSDLQAARKIFLQLRKFRRQIALSFAWVYEDGFHLRTGETVQDVIQEIRYWPLFAFGANCALGSQRLAELGKIFAEQSPFDVWIKANAGQPRLEGGRAVYDEDPSEFASYLEPLIGVARYLGGCCGTDERFLAALKGRIEHG